jgi:hypothetical protein
MLRFSVSRSGCGVSMDLVCFFLLQKTDENRASSILSILLLQETEDQAKLYCRSLSCSLYHHLSIHSHWATMKEKVDFDLI